MRRNELQTVDEWLAPPRGQGRRVRSDGDSPQAPEGGWAEMLGGNGRAVLGKTNTRKASSVGRNKCLLGTGLTWV